MVKECGRDRRGNLIAMKENMLMIKSVVMENFSGSVGIYIRGITLMILDMILAKCIGQMAQLTKENGKKVFNMAVA